MGEDGVPGIKLSNRKCTDPIFCLCFLFWIIVMVGISGFAFYNGDLNRLAYKFDMDLVPCS